MRTILPPNSNPIPDHAERVFEGAIFDVYQWQQKMFDGTTETYEMLKRPDSVDVIAVKDGKILINHEQQSGRSDFYDIPGGRHEIESETELEAAQRELFEETGMRFKTWRPVYANQPQSKIDWVVYTFLVTDFIDQQDPQQDSGERIESKFYNLDQAIEILKSDKARWFPTVLDNVKSVDDLLNLPTYKDKS